MKKILITGSGGLLGKCLTVRLAKAGYDIVGLTHNDLSSDLENVSFITLDFSSSWSINELPDDIDVVIHLAQSSRFREFPEQALNVFNVNIESTAKLLDYANSIGAKKFIYASSGGVYGNSNNAFNENAPIVTPGMLGHYLGSKACGEILVQSYASHFKVGIIRPFFMYGAEQNRTMLIPRLYDSIINGRPIILQGDNGIRINPIHIEDASCAVEAMLNLNESTTFNIAGPDTLTIREICQMFGNYLGIEPVFDFVEGGARDLIGDITLMSDLLIRPKIHLVDVIGELAGEGK